MRYAYTCSDNTKIKTKSKGKQDMQSFLRMTCECTRCLGAWPRSSPCLRLSHRFLNQRDRDKEQTREPRICQIDPPTFPTNGNEWLRGDTQRAYLRSSRVREEARNERLRENSRDENIEITNDGGRACFWEEYGAKEGHCNQRISPKEEQDKIYAKIVVDEITKWEGACKGNHTKRCGQKPTVQPFMS